MEEKKSSKKITRSRRDMLKKVGVTSAFVVPTIVSYQLSELAVAASSPYPAGPPGEYGG